jgi:pentafunctional AROM polypeptide
MHNGAFDALRLPHRYGLREESTATSYIDLLSDPSFGGASVTIPHKETIIPLIDEVRGAALSIGAVNTVVPEVVVNADGTTTRRLVGFNTDWLGIKRPLLRQLLARGGQWSNSDSSSSGSDRKRSIGLVIGAGGTAKAACYAVKDLGTVHESAFKQ